MVGVRTAIKNLLREEHPMTNRQVFYRLVGLGRIEKLEKEYQQTVTRLLTEMRLGGEIPFEWIVDATRWDHKTPRFDSLEDLLARADYRRTFWRGDERLEVWIEKEALAAIVQEITDPLDVSLMVTRGYSSISFLHESAKNIVAHGRAGRLTTIYILGDYDPSGQDIIRHVAEKLTEWSGGYLVDVIPLAVTLEQIEQWQLPTRPTKQSDSRAKNFNGESVELDAIPPAEFRRLIRDALMQHVDEDELKQANGIEKGERRMLRRLARAMRKPRGRRGL
jgi:hypothetical protein